MFVTSKVVNMTLYPTLHILQKCSAWTKCGPKNVFRPNRSTVRPANFQKSELDQNTEDHIPHVSNKQCMIDCVNFLHYSSEYSNS